MTVCITRLREIERPALRLFLFHSAGGSHLLFRGWEDAFPADWELCAVEAPGRGRLADRPLAPNADSFAASVLPTLASLLDRPFALFGHSMGGLLAYDLARRLAVCGLPEPVWLGVSARRAPGEPQGGTQKLSWDLPDGELRRAVAQMGGTSASVLEDPRLWAILEPILRADLRLADTWRSPDATAFAAPPLSVFAGADDPFISSANLEAWSQRSGRFMGVHRFPGGHFYLQQCLPELARHIVADVSTCTRCIAA